ncbi:MAG: hypothetical protein A2840_01010 [Candidatus Buchananbacteria bacterium RIFCSPHIGHO2_01_FULL_47_11b]|uniref:Glycosyltransferase 2-like domain-containing protein n=1 Tax=Candidatus Buchananbacteria bacterium RIFCSPHIGHO2_01_FULL_47_11b TaxID=1797537 RepID=A0A1G1Y650_9BACT|nr:MAG: hypothetical protein A2840_01010 [Candidatus Buchananbacteria bacterium RIFCSPHIGHO2_01_FULL_47_11b]
MNIILVTTTFYKNIEELRFQLVCRTIDQAVSAGYPIVVVDGSPDLRIAKKLSDTGAIVFPEILRGMAASRRQAIFCALNHCYFNLGDSQVETAIVWLEPEKYDIVRFIPQIVEPIQRGDAMVVIPKRSEQSWQTYPEFQQISEQQANAAYTAATGRHGFDPMFGPMAFRADELAMMLLWNPAVANVQSQYHHHFWPLLISASEVSSVEIDFCYPPEQKQAEEADAATSGQIMEKRQQQLTQLSADYQAVADFLKR